MYENKNNFSPINLQNNPDIIPDRGNHIHQFKFQYTKREAN